MCCTASAAGLSRSGSRFCCNCSPITSVFIDVDNGAAAAAGAEGGGSWSRPCSRAAHPLPTAPSDFSAGFGLGVIVTIVFIVALVEVSTRWWPAGPMNPRAHSPERQSLRWRGSRNLPELRLRLFFCFEPAGTPTARSRNLARRPHPNYLGPCVAGPFSFRPAASAPLRPGLTARRRPTYLCWGRRAFSFHDEEA
jgi:hypothetical protein